MERLVSVAKILTGDTDAGFDGYVETPELPLQALGGGLADSPMLYVTDDKTIEVVDFGIFLTTEDIAVTDETGNIDLGLRYYSVATSAWVTDPDFFVAAAKVGTIAASVGGKRGDTLSVMRHNGLVAGPKGANFVWATDPITALASTQAGRRVNRLGIAPGRTDLKAECITMRLTQAATSATGKGILWMRFKVIKAAYGEI